ncbi:MAG: putative histidine kinase, hybrid [Chlorobi bacterium]|nr:putative histidine kinase, hybrid [Chlorobiota bacterium]
MLAIGLLATVVVSYSAAVKGLFTSHPPFDHTSGADAIPYLAAGVLISIFLFAIIRSQLRALDRSESMAAEWRRSEERYRTIIETAPDVIFTLAPDGVITSLSPAFEQIAGWPPAEWIGRSFVPIVHPDDLAVALEHFGELLRGETPSTYELRILSRSGEYLDVEFRTRPYIDNGRIVGAIGIARDVTERRRISETLRTSEERYRAFVENSTEAIWRFELEPGIPVDLPVDEQIELAYSRGYLAECNTVMARMYGHDSAEEVIGARLADMLVASNPGNIAYLRAFIESGYSLADAESAELDRDGNQKYFLNNLVGVVENGMLIRAWGTQRDITERKLAAEERDRLYLREQQALADARAANISKDRFLAILSHELRTPLTPVLGAIELLDTTSESVCGLVEIIRRNVELEARLIDDLLDLTGIANGKMQIHPVPVDAHHVLAAAIDGVRADADRKMIAMDIAMKAAGHVVVADPVRLQQIFWNLLRNAIKFTPEGGRISVTTGATEGRLCVAIRDTGIGIEPDVLPRIFNPFEQGERTITRQFGGLGLGLAISRMLVDMHGGTLRAESPGRNLGTTLILEFPLIDDEIRQ